MEDLNQKIKAVFVEKGWSLDSADGANKYYRGLASKFYSFLYPLTSEEQDLIFSLLKIYHYCPLIHYEPLVCKLARAIREQWNQEYDRLYVVSLTKPKDAGHPKGASFILGHLRDQTIQEECELDDVPMSLFDNQELILKKHSKRNKSLIIFVDDFIGSGKTAIRTLHYFINNIKNDTDKIIVFSFVTMHSAIAQIEELGIEVNSFLTLPKGISESGLFENVDDTIRLMTELEKKKSIPPKYSLGFKKTEATVTLMRTPNNTFPVFWFPSDEDGNKSLAPFRRHK